MSSTSKRCRYSVLIILLAALSGCKDTSADLKPEVAPAPSVHADPVIVTALKNCHFENVAPVYAFHSAIEANPIICEQGVVTHVELVSPDPLPSGLQFSMDKLSLVGTANEKVNQAPYQFYIENKAGYSILKLTVTIK